MLDARFEVHKDKTLREATEMAWKVQYFLSRLHYTHLSSFEILFAGIAALCINVQEKLLLLVYIYGEIAVLNN